MADEEQSNVKRMKFDNAMNAMHIGDDLSAPNTKLVVSINRKLYLDEKFADIHFVFETSDIEPIPSHKCILSTGSKVFETMFYGSIREGDVVKISDVNPSAFKEFLQFFYLDEVNFTTDNIVDVMYLVRKYGIERCMVQCVDFLKDTMTNDDVCSAYQLAVQFDLDELKHFCQRKISANAEDVLKSNDFLNCKHTVLQLIVAMDSLIIEEINVFDACLTWAKKSCEVNGMDFSDGKNLRAQLGASVLHSIHFNRMNIEHFASRNAEFEGLFTIPELSEILQLIANKKFKPSSFTANPISYEIFTWDEKRTFECSLCDRLGVGKTSEYNQKSDLVHISCNKPLLLHQFQFAKVNSTESCDTYTAEIQLLQKIDENKKSIFKQNFCFSSENVVFVKLSKPVLIHPKRSYIIRLVYSTSYLFQSPYMKYGKIEVGDLELNVSGSKSSCNGFTLLSTLYFNRI